MAGTYVKIRLFINLKYMMYVVTIRKIWVELT